MVRLVLPEEPLVATVDRDRIGQVLTNLLSNALKYTPADQPVDLTLMTVEALADPEEKVPDSRATLQRVARITVRDHGSVIPPEVRSQLFERYYRVPGVKALHSQRRGLALGLYIARELVERHGGQIGVDSVVGDGSTFWLTLPLAPAAH
jgi:signal transduction histidine kinase